VIVGLLVVTVVAGGVVAVLAHHRGGVSATVPPTVSPSPSPSASATPRPSPTSAPGLVASARWFPDGSGFQLRVRPAPAGRRSAAEAPGRALAEALTAARPTPLTLTRSVRQSLTNQLRCHANFAPRKPTWDLETWRPNVGYVQTVLALCNP
jgi:hypothetical protein